LVAAALVIGILLAEVLARSVIVLPKMLPALDVDTYVLADNPILKYVYRPGSQATGVPFDADHRGFTINSAGFRDYEFREEKPAGTRRLVVLGDSTSAGNGISDVTHIAAKVLERMLNGAGAGPFQVYNLAVGGYHTYQEAEMLRVKGLRYRPDLVLVGFCLNDFDYAADGNVAARLGHAFRAPDGNAVSPATRWASWLVGRSHLAFMVQRFRQVRAFDRAMRARDPVDRGFELLERIHRDTGIPIVVFIIPAFQAPFDQYTYGALHQQVLDVQRRYPAVEVVDLLVDFRERRLDAQSLSSDTVHPNPAGSRAIAAALFRHVARRHFHDLPPNPPGPDAP
jgi:lysophospholipase L1-like esterase